MPRTTTDFINDVGRNTQASNTAYSALNTDILEWGNKELLSYLAPRILRENEELFVTTKDIQTVVGQARYRMPIRTISGRLRDVWLIVNGVNYNLVRFEPENALQPSSQNIGTPEGFYMEGDSVVLVPAARRNSTLMAAR